MSFSNLLNTRFYLTVIHIFSVQLESVNGISLDLEDILNTQMMPVHVFSSLNFNKKLEQKYFKGFQPVLQTMDYHRKMMQQFMASDYLTKEILNLQFAHPNDTKIKKRLGKLENEKLSRSDDFSVPDTSINKLLFDDGSAKYNAWLKRTTTLDDIQKQLREANKEIPGNTTSIRKRKIHDPDVPSSYSLGDDDEAEDGDITGYAFDSSHHDNNYIKLYPNNVPHMPRHALRNTQLLSSKGSLSKSGYDTGYADYGAHHPPPEHSIPASPPSKPTKEISLKDITDIALTTLAFLSFGMFILQVLMCITMSKEDTSNLMMLPMESTEPVDTNDGTEEIRRRKRAILPNQAIIIGINELSEVLLNKIDHLYLNDDKDKSTEKFDFKRICKYSQFLTGATGIHKNIWTTLYSLGSSWLAARKSNDYISMIRRLRHVFEMCK